VNTTRREFLAIFDDWFVVAADYPAVAGLEDVWRLAVAAADLPEEGERRQFCDALLATDLLGRRPLAILKSSYLARRFAGQPTRTIRCPKHDGVWAGIFECEHGCEMTGWVP